MRSLAAAVASGAEAAGASVRLRSVRDEAGGPGAELADLADLADLVWADAVVWGTPTHYGNVSAPLKEFIDSTGPAGLWSALLSAYSAMHQWDAVVLAPGYTDPVVNAAGGNPYGTLHHAGNGPSEESAAAAAHYQGRRFAIATAALATPPRTPQDRPRSALGSA